MSKRLVILMISVALMFVVFTTYAKDAGKEVKTIVIDPAFGGVLPGPIGPGGLQSKEVTLDIALRLEKLITQKLDAKVILTRREDQFVSREDRIAIANNNKADLFIIISTNESPDPEDNGFETYINPFTIKIIRPAKESMGKPALKTEKPVMLRMIQNKNFKQSIRLAQLIQRELPKKVKTKNRGVKRGEFNLLGARMPSVAVKVAFITNPQEEKRLKTRRFREKIAQALFEAIQAYTKEELKSKGK